MDSAQTLLLNQGFEPIKVISWQRAISLLFLGKVEVLEEYDWAVRSVTLVVKTPAVIRLLRVFRRRRHQVRFSRVNRSFENGSTGNSCRRAVPGATVSPPYWLSTSSIPSSWR